MALNRSGPNRLLPLLVIGTLVAVNGAVLVTGMLHDDSGKIWTGPLLPGRILRLPDPAAAIIVPAAPEATQAAASAAAKAEPVAAGAMEAASAEAKAAPEAKAAAETGTAPEAKAAAETGTAAESKAAAETGTAAETSKAAAETGAVARAGMSGEGKADAPPAAKEPTASVEAPVPASAPAPVAEGFVVQLGSYVLQMGADSMVQQLQSSGLKPHVLVYREQVRLNNVQAGPFKSLEEAKEAEAKLKAGGVIAETEEIWEGFILSVSKSILLSYAVEDMKKVTSLGVEPVRMVKVEADLPVRKVVLGPYPTKDEATAMSVQASRLGLVVPVIKPYLPPDEPLEKN